MLDEVALAGAPFLSVRQQLTHYVELMESREDLLRGLPTAPVVRLFNHLRIIFEDVGEVPLGENLLPQIVGLQAMGIRRIASTIIPALVERQEPACLPLQVRAHPHLVIVYREVNDAAPELEQQFLRVPIALVLFDGVLDRLLRKAVL